MSKPIFCYSRDGETYYGDFDTREAALAEVVADFDPGEDITVHTGEQRHAMHFLRKWEASVGEHVVEQLDEWLIDCIASDDCIVELDKEKTAELGKLVLDFLEKHASFNRWGVTEVQEHSVTVPEEGGAA